MSDFIPIDTIEPPESGQDTDFVPKPLADDPISGDGSCGRSGVKVEPWRVRTLKSSRLRSLSEPGFGNDEVASRARRVHEASREHRGEGRRKRRGVARVIVGFIVVAMLVFAAMMAGSYALELWGGKTVPNVLGISQGNAVADLEGRGFRCQVETVAADEAQGHVISLEPHAGERVPTGSTITLYISKSRTIPAVVGLTREEARIALEEAGAKNIRFKSHVLLEEEDAVLEVIPAEGSTFMSSDEVTVVVSELPRVPDVAGLNEVEARDKLAREGVPCVVAYEPAGIDNRLLVVRCDPAIGEKANEDGIVLYLGDPLVAVTRPADYLDATSEHINEFLIKGGLEQKLGYRDDAGHLVARYEDGVSMTVAFTAEPWSQNVMRDEHPLTSVMDEWAHVEGVRLAISPVSRTDIERERAERIAEVRVEAQAEVQARHQEAEEKAANASGDDAGANAGDQGQGQDDPEALQQEIEEVVQEKLDKLTFGDPLLALDEPTVSDDTAREVMGLLGFDNLLDSCTRSTSVLPAGTGASGHAYLCLQGEKGGDVWTLLLRGVSTEDGCTVQEIVATVAPRTVYEQIDLTPYGGKICNYVAFQDEYVG